MYVSLHRKNRFLNQGSTDHLVRTPLNPSWFEIFLFFLVLVRSEIHFFSVGRTGISMVISKIYDLTSRHSDKMVLVLGSLIRMQELLGSNRWKSGNSKITTFIFLGMNSKLRLRTTEFKTEINLERGPPLDRMNWIDMIRHIFYLLTTLVLMVSPSDVEFQMNHPIRRVNIWLSKFLNRLMKIHFKLHLVIFKWKYRGFAWLDQPVRTKSVTVQIFNLLDLVSCPRITLVSRTIDCSHNLLMVCYIPYKIYGRKNDDCLLLTIKVFAKKVFFSQPQKEFSIWSLWVKIFLHRPQKLKKLGFESFKNTPLKIRAMPCTYSGKLQFANTHCGNRLHY